MGTGGGAGGDGHRSVARCEALFLGAVGSGGCFGGCQRAGAELVPLGIAATQPWGGDQEGATTQTLRWGHEGHETVLAVTVSLLPQNRGRHNERRHGGRAAGFDQEDPDLLHQRGPARARGLREPGGPLLPRRQPQQERAGGCRGRAPPELLPPAPCPGFLHQFSSPSCSVGFGSSILGSRQLLHRPKDPGRSSGMEPGAFQSLFFLSGGSNPSSLPLSQALCSAERHRAAAPRARAVFPAFISPSHRSLPC